MIDTHRYGQISTFSLLPNIPRSGGHLVETLELGLIEEVVQHGDDPGVQVLGDVRELRFLARFRRAAEPGEAGVGFLEHLLGQALRELNLNYIRFSDVFFESGNS